MFKFIALAGIAVLLGLALFFAGLGVGALKWWPYQGLQQSWQVLRSLVRYGTVAPEGQLVRAPAAASRQPWTLHSPDLQQAGQYVMVGWEQTARQYSARLFSRDGRLLHRWPIDSTRLGRNASTREPEAPHPVALLPDGSIIVGFDKGRGMTRLDACGEPLWVKAGYFHHSLDQAEDGSFWTWRGSNGAYVSQQYLHNFDSETGEPIREIGLYEDVIRKMGPEAQIFGLQPGQALKPGGGKALQDIFHPNDLETLDTHLEQDFDLFEAGDLLLSLRNLHLVAVLDPDSLELKWWSRGPWLFQHDPDFLPGGIISVYSNNSGRTQSSLVQVNPSTGDLSYPLAESDVHFYSQFMGKHQYLPNGNVLLVVPGEGRVLELTADGQLVLEFNNLAAPGDAHNAHVEHGFWLAPDFYPRMPGCP